MIQKQGKVKTLERRCLMWNSTVALAAQLQDHETVNGKPMQDWYVTLLLRDANLSQYYTNAPLYCLVRVCAG
jgi:hypothetical protein